MDELSEWLNNRRASTDTADDLLRVDSDPEVVTGRHFASDDVLPALEDSPGRHFASEVVLPQLEETRGRHFADEIPLVTSADFAHTVVPTPVAVEPEPVAAKTVQPIPSQDVSAPAQRRQPVAATPHWHEDAVAESLLELDLPEPTPSLGRKQFPDQPQSARLPSPRWTKFAEPLLVASSIAALVMVSTLNMGPSTPAPMQAMDTADRTELDRASRSAAVSDRSQLPSTSSPTVPPTTAAPTTTTTTTEPPPTTTTTAPPPPVDAGPVGDDVWQKLANCEAGGRNHTGGPYYGYFQFLPSTWRSVGGTGLPSDHDYATQKSFAQKLQARSGWGQWPACASKLGLR